MLLSPLGLRSHPSRIVIYIMSRKFTLDNSPPVNRWMKDSLVKDAFRKSIPVLAVRTPAASSGPLVKAMALKKYIYIYPSTSHHS
jgi:tRNA (guanine37-N1)-methyltransferase